MYLTTDVHVQARILTKQINTSAMSPVKRAAAESTGIEWMGSKSGRETIFSSCRDAKARKRGRILDNIIPNKNTTGNFNRAVSSGAQISAAKILIDYNDG